MLMAPLPRLPRPHCPCPRQANKHRVAPELCGELVQLRFLVSGFKTKVGGLRVWAWGAALRIHCVGDIGVARMRS